MRILVAFLLLGVLHSCSRESKKTALSQEEVTAIVKVPAEDNSITAYEFSIPSGWQAEGHISYDTEALLTPLLFIEANHSYNKSFIHGHTLGSYFYTASGPSGFLSEGEDQLSKSYRKLPNILQYNALDVMPHITTNYSITSQKILKDFIYTDNPQNHSLVLYSELRDSDNPQNMGALYTIILSSQNYPGVQQWIGGYYLIESDKQTIDEAKDALKTIANSLQENPIYAKYIYDLNAESIRYNKKAYQVNDDELQGLGEYYQHQKENQYAENLRQSDNKPSQNQLSSL